MKKKVKTMANRNDEYPADFVSRAASLSVSDSTINEEERTVEAVIATSNPVTVLDRNRWEVVDEILMMDGVVLPENRQVPFLDDHSRDGTESIIGSVRDIKVDGETVRGKIHFAKRAEEEFELVKERHLTDVSAGYRIYPESSIYIEKGQEVEVRGKTIKNKGERTLVIRNKWELKETSATPIGADEDTKMRKEVDETTSINSKGENMSEKTTKEKAATEERNIAQYFWNNFVYQCVIEGKVSISPQVFISDPYKYTRVSFQFPPWDWVDPRADTDAVVNLSAAGLSTLKEVCSKKGIDWRDHVTQKAEEYLYIKQIAEEKDIPIERLLAVIEENSGGRDEEKSENDGKQE